MIIWSKARQVHIEIAGNKATNTYNYLLSLVEITLMIDDTLVLNLLDPYFCALITGHKVDIAAAIERLVLILFIQMTESALIIDFV